MSKLILTFTVGSLLLYSCGNSTNEKSNNQTEVAEQNNHHHDDESEAIELNNGEKWKVDANMITHIRNMENDINHFANVEQKDFKSLAEKLQANIDLLTSNCTMTGQAHDELHKWLLPYMDLVDELSVAEDKIEAEKQFQEIQSSFKTFNHYFQ
jgi:hypothetical protein